MGIHCTIIETFLSLKSENNVKQTKQKTPQNTNRIRALKSDISMWLKRVIKVTRRMLFCLRLSVKWKYTLDYTND